MRTLSEATSSMTIFIFMRLFKKVLKLKKTNTIHFIHTLLFSNFICKQYQNRHCDVLICFQRSFHNYINVKPKNEEIFTKNSFQQTESNIQDVEQFSPVHYKCKSCKSFKLLIIIQKHVSWLHSTSMMIIITIFNDQIAYLFSNNGNHKLVVIVFLQAWNSFQIVQFGSL